MTSNGGPARLVRVYGLWILLVTAVVMGAAYGVSLLGATRYRSAAIVVVEARVRENTTPVQPEMGTEKELAHSGLILQPAGKELGVDPGKLGEGLSITVATDANVLSFNYDAADPRTAQSRAQAIAEAYVDYRNSGETQSSSPAGRSAAAANTNAHATLVTAAYYPSVPEARPVYIDLAVGAVLGLLLGIGGALIRDRMSDRIRGLGDFEHLTGVTVLATIPRTRKPRGDGAHRPVLLRAPESPAAESYRYLRSRLQPLLRDGRATVLVTSAAEGEGRSTTAANLALALALSGRTVVLVDADLRRPRQHAMLDLPGERGLTALLRGEATAAELLREGPVPRLRLLPAGEGADAAADLLEGPRLARAIRTVRQQCDVVVVDAAAVLSVADAIALAAVSDHLLLVGDYRRTTRASLVRTLAELREVTHANVSGVLVNAPRSAGGLVPRARAGSAVPVDEDVTEAINLAFGAAAVPKSLTGSAVYRSASSGAPSVAPAGAAGGPTRPIAPSGPVKQRDKTNGAAAVPAPRGGDSEPRG